MKSMRKLIAAASVAALALTACQEERFEGTDNSDKYFASVETFGSDTKTALGEGRSVVWSAEDRIAIFEGVGQGKVYQVLDSYIGKSSGEFSLVEETVPERFYSLCEGTVAVYPFDEDLAVSFNPWGDDIIVDGINFPAEQKYEAGSFSDETFPMVALTPAGSKNLSFKNIGGILKFSLTGSYSVSQITLTGNSGEPLSGSATVTIGPDGIPAVEMSDDASTSVTLICDPAVQLDTEKATDFYISIPPTDFEAGFIVTVTDSEGRSKSKQSYNSNEISRSSILKMPTFNLDDAESSSVFARIDPEVLSESIWETGMINENGDYILVKTDLTNRICISGNENNGPKLYFVLNESNDVVEFLYEDLYCTIEYDENNMYVNAVTPAETQMHIFDFNRNSPISYNSAITKSPHTRSSEANDILKEVGKGLWNISTTGGAVNLIVDFFKGKDISKDLDAYGVSVLIGTKSNLAGYMLSSAYEIYKSVENYHKIDEERYFGNCSVKISNAVKEADGSYTLNIDITDLPDADMIMPGGIKVGVVIGKKKDKVIHPQNHNSDAFYPENKNCWIIAEKDVDNTYPNSSVTMTLESFYIDEDETYYARPYLIQFITNGFSIIESSRQIRYGEFITIPFDEKWVDLGLSVLWAAYNVGASSPEEYGGYYAWGETEEKSNYSGDNYNWNFIGSEISGTSYDVAHVKWGDGARMPTLDEVKELVNNCTFKYGTYNGVSGDYVTGPNGNSIFLPFAGCRSIDALYPEGYYGCFWSGTYVDDFDACYLYCGKDHGSWSGYDRSYGHSVRPVTEK